MKDLIITISVSLEESAPIIEDMRRSTRCAEGDLNIFTCITGRDDEECKVSVKTIGETRQFEFYIDEEHSFNPLFHFRSWFPDDHSFSKVVKISQQQSRIAGSLFTLIETYEEYLSNLVMRGCVANIQRRPEINDMVPFYMSTTDWGFNYYIITAEKLENLLKGLKK